MNHLGDRLAAVLEVTPADDRAEMLAHLRRQRDHAIARRAADLALIHLIDMTIATHERTHP